jgi:hypothetical protein
MTVAKPYIHAISSARKFGGVASDYMAIHMWLDGSKAAFPDNRHRALTHNSWFISVVLEAVHFPQYGWHGPLLVRESDGKTVSVRDVAEQHILEDFGGRFIPTAQDYLQELEMRDWMNNGMDGSNPPSHQKLSHAKVTKTEQLFTVD